MVNRTALQRVGILEIPPSLAVLQLDFENGTNGGQDATDVSPAQRTITWVSSAAVSNVQAKNGTLSLDTNSDAGSTDYITVPRVAFGTDDFTIEAWVYASGLDNIFFHAPMGNLDGTTGSWCFYVTDNPNNYLVWASTGHTAIFGSTSMATGTWHHVAACRSSGTLRLFLGGVLQGSSDYSAIDIEGASAIAVGGNQSGSNDRWEGYLDMVRIELGFARYDSDTSFTPPVSF